MLTTRILTSVVLGLCLLAGTAYAANADVSGIALGEPDGPQDVDPSRSALDEGRAVMAGKGGKGGGGGGPTATPTPQPTEPPPGGGSLGDMYVSSLATYFGSTQDTYYICQARVSDSDGEWVEDAVVTFEVTDPWTGQHTVQMRAVPGYEEFGNIDAWLEFRENKRNSCGKRGVPDTYTCTVVDVYHYDYTYNPALNVETTETTSCE